MNRVRASLDEAGCKMNKVIGYTRKLNQAQSVSSISKLLDRTRPKSGNAGLDLEPVTSPTGSSRQRKTALFFKSPDLKSNDKSRDRKRNSHSASQFSVTSVISKEKALSCVDPIDEKIEEKLKKTKDA